MSETLSAYRLKPVRSHVETVVTERTILRGNVVLGKDKTTEPRRVVDWFFDYYDSEHDLVKDYAMSPDFFDSAYEELDWEGFYRQSGVFHCSKPTQEDLESKPVFNGGNDFSDPVLLYTGMAHVLIGKDDLSFYFEPVTPESLAQESTEPSVITCEHC